MYRSLYSFFVKCCRWLSWHWLIGIKHGICPFVQLAQAQELIFNLEINALLAAYLTLPLKPSNFSTHKWDRWWTSWVTWFTSKQKTSDNIFRWGNPIGSYSFQQCSSHSFNRFRTRMVQWQLCSLLWPVHTDVRAGRAEQQNQLDCSHCCFDNRKWGYHACWEKSSPPSVRWLYFKKMKVFLKGGNQTSAKHHMWVLWVLQLLHSECSNCEDGHMWDTSSLIP